MSGRAYPAWSLRRERAQAIALWERGEELYRLCAAKLDAAQGKIEELATRAAEAAPGS